MPDRCEIPRCRADADLSYLGHGVCTPHWIQFMNENAPPEALRIALGIEAAPDPLMEDVMSSKKKAETKSEPKPEKPAKKSSSKGQAPMRTVALRVPEEDFQLLHKAAGDRQLAHFMRTTLLAAAQKAVAK